MIDGEVRNIEVKVLSVRPSVRVRLAPPGHLHPLLIRPGGIPFFQILSPSESLSLSCCSTNFVSLQKLPHPAGQTVSFSEGRLSSSLIDHLVIGSRVVGVVFVPAGSVHVSVLQAHLNTTAGFPIMEILSSVLSRKPQLSPFLE